MTCETKLPLLSADAGVLANVINTDKQQIQASAG
jgi:hypothetical protein